MRCAFPFCSLSRRRRRKHQQQELPCVIWTARAPSQTQFTTSVQFNNHAHALNFGLPARILSARGFVMRDRILVRSMETRESGIRRGERKVWVVALCTTWFLVMWSLSSSHRYPLLTCTQMSILRGINEPRSLRELSNVPICQTMVQHQINAIQTKFTRKHFELDLWHNKRINKF